LGEKFRAQLSHLRENAPEDASQREAFLNYFSAVSDLLVQVKFAKRKSSTTYSLFNSVKFTFKALARALGIPMSQEEEAEYDARSISPSGLLAVVNAWLWGSSINATQHLRVFYQRVGVPEARLE
jgi:hypothetical protein